MASHTLTKPHSCNEYTQQQIYLVFDGASGQEKRATEKDRAAKRMAALQLGNRLQSTGDYEGARRAFQAATEITPDVAKQVISLEQPLS